MSKNEFYKENESVLVQPGIKFKFEDFGTIWKVEINNGDQMD